MSRIALASTRISFKRQLLCSVFALGMIVPSGVAAASPYTETLRTALQNDPTHFNERMWEVIRANPADRDQIFGEAVRMSMKHEIALHPTQKAEIVVRFKKLYPQLAEELQAEAAGQKVAMSSVESFQQPMKLRSLAQDPEYVSPGHTTWFGRNWPWVALAGAGAVGAGVAIAISTSDSGSSSTSAAPPAVLPDPPTVGETQEYANQGGLGRIHAGEANEAGFTGQGIVVAVVDTGLNTLHPDLKNNIAPGGYDFIRNTATIKDYADVEFHGSHVSGIIAAGRNGFGMRGVAYNAKILPLAAISSGGGPLNAVELAFNRATDLGADVLNGSFGPGDAANQSFVDNGAQFFWNQALRDADAIKNFIDNGGIPVFAAGNSFTPSSALINNNPTGLGFVPFIRPSNANIAIGQPGAYRASEDGVTLTTLNADYSSLEGKLIVVVALKEDNTIADFSNRCGVTKDWCIGAPGVNITSTLSSNSYIAYDGTSMAAPHVAGAVAVLLEQHPELTQSQIVHLLLTSATDIGDAGVDDIYGHGLLNLNAATQATGPFSVVTGTNLSSGSVLLVNSSLHSSPVFGQSFANKLAATKIGVLDANTLNFKTAFGKQVVLRVASFSATDALERLARDEARTKFALDKETSLSFTPKSKNGVDRVADDAGLKGAFDSLSLTHNTGDGITVDMKYGDARANALSFSEADTSLLSSRVTSSGIGNPYLDFVADGYASGVTLDLPWTGRFRAVTGMGKQAGDSDTKNLVAMAELGFGNEKTGLVFSSGALIEKDRVLGMRGEGALALGKGTTTWFGGVTGNWQMAPRTQLTASFNGGMTEAVGGASNSLVQGFDRITTTSWRLGVTQSDLLQEQDRLRFSVSQPLRAESGSANIILPEKRLRNYDMVRQDASFALAPTGREIDVETSYRFTVGEASHVELAGLYRHDAGHIAGKNEVIGLTRFSRGF